ncbi:glycosyltransferase family 2 protein [Flavobacterium weaverense]|uniref:Rhamnosyltransferase n=1 Tax=Flavobacterium weaverense TaxID=271156 RepID=A0A3L9ZWG2_9FLAO|nr:glycosyltransferase family 2 protein [Flavobacterium weaverense]RMA74838.1 rhamnosyltransferase [Flavobacterium weaverense]
MSVVDIAMATYNGEKYLLAQLESILSQSFTDFRLFIRDDGSSDSTIEIIKSYAKKDSRIHFIDDNLGNLRVSRNFEQALTYCTAPYIMFADQDDVWFKNKIDVSLSYIKKVELIDKPVLVFSNSILSSETLDKEYGNNYSQDLDVTLKSFLFGNAGYQGAAMIFNQKLKQMALPFLANSCVHDYHISLIGLLLGNVCFINTPLMLYRRHSDATTKQNLTLFGRLKCLFEGDSILYNEKMLNYLKDFASFYKSNINTENINILNDYFEIVENKTSFSKRIQLVRKNKFKVRGSSKYLIFKIFLLR